MLISIWYYFCLDEQITHYVRQQLSDLSIKETSENSNLMHQSKNCKDAQYYFNLGNAFIGQSKVVEAIEAYETAISLRPDFSGAFNNLGICLHNSNKLLEAIEAYNQAISCDITNSGAFINLGNALHEQGNSDEAVAAYNRAISIDPNNSEVFQNLGSILQKQGKLDEAFSAYSRSISIKPENAQVRNNLGNLLKELGRSEEALSAYKIAVSLQPDFAEAYNNMGILFQQLGQQKEAITAYTKAISLQPDFAEAHEHLSFSLLSSGNIVEGLKEYEWRWASLKKSKLKRNFSQPLWDGAQSLRDKRILIWGEQGIGDIINWCSRLALIKSWAHHCILECPQKLVPLLSRSFPDIEFKVEDKSDDRYRDDFDVHLPLGSLYRHFSSHVARNPKPDAYLYPGEGKIKYWKERLKSLGKGPYVGICWKSSKISTQRIHNYANLSEWSPILNIEDVTYVNLQYVDFDIDLRKVNSDLGITVHNFDDLDHYNDLVEVAALCAALDMVVSTKITVPFISAGVGTVTKLANWRQSPWNNILLNPAGPHVDVFERNTWEPWESVFEAIAQDIITLRDNPNKVTRSS